MNNRLAKDRTFTFVLLMPWIITFCVFWLYPILYAAYLSLTQHTTLNNKSIFIGFDNYIALFKDKIFFKALSNTAIFTFGTVPVTTIISLFLAVLINSKLAKYKEFFKTAFFMPSVTSLVVISLIFFNLYSQDGYINYILKSLDLPFPARGWLQEPSVSLLSIMLMDIWGAVGYYMILFFSGNAINSR